MQHKEWLLAEAKNKLTEVVNMALIEPQMIRRRKDVMVLMSITEYESLQKKKLNFKDYLLSPPHAMEDIDFERDKTPMRDIIL